MIDHDGLAEQSGLLADHLEGYPEGVNRFCEIDGGVRCLRNDQAPDVLWYNKAFFDENGYAVPETWEEYGELAIQIAEEHPGKLSGFLGDVYAPSRYLWASGCPTNDRIDESKVHIDPSDPKCTRVVEMLDGMIAAGATTPVGIFSADSAEPGGELVMSPGALWWGNYLFRDVWGQDYGQISAAKPLRWADDPEPGFTGNEGGGLWGVSTHITGKQLENALTFAKFVSGDPAWQVELSTGMPAYGPVQEPWLENMDEVGFYSDFDGLVEAFGDAESRVRDGFSFMLYNTGGIWQSTITPALTEGKLLSEAWDTFGDQLINEAKVFGYEVVDEAE